MKAPCRSITTWSFTLVLTVADPVFPSKFRLTIFKIPFCISECKKKQGSKRTSELQKHESFQGPII